MTRRRGLFRRSFPWLFALALISVVGVGAVRAWRSRDPVAVAEALRKGNVEAQHPKDPAAAIDVLERALADDPRNVPALIEMARAWQDLRAWDNAIETLQRACDASSSVDDKIQAKTMAMSLLATADRYDEAVSVGQEIIALAPDDPVYRLRLGPVYLKGSVSAQELALSRVMDRATKDLKDLRVEDEVEAWVTDLWSDAGVDDLVTGLAPGADAVFKQSLADTLVSARERFRQANATLAGFADYGGFDPVVARAWCQVLQRSGRLFDAHVEAGMALREPTLNTAFRRDFLDVQTRCAIAMGDWKQAADHQAAIIDAFLADPQLPPVPFATVWWMYEARVRSGQWDWILAHVDADALHYGRDDPVLRWARAAALDGKGQSDDALKAVLDPFATVSLVARNALPPSLKLFPERRRAVAMLAFKLFSAAKDSKAGNALDAVLSMDPSDPEALRLRSELSLAAGNLEAAVADAFALLVPQRRDRADFDRWFHASDQLSQERHDAPLAARARSRVEKAEGLQRSVGDASYTSFKALGLKAPKDDKAPLPIDQLYSRTEPALCFAIVEELIAQGDVERARTELRKLSEDWPDVQEFRFRLGKLLVREGQFDFAADEFRELLDSIPGDTEALDLAVRTELALDRPQEAAGFVTRTILADPLGAGAVRYGQRLLDRGHPDEAEKLVERIARSTSFGTRLDVLVLAARAHLALGKVDDAASILGSLATAYPDSFDVALLGLDVGLAKGQDGLVAAAVEALKPIAPELFPDQLQQMADRLLAAGLDSELVAIFDDTVCALPAAQLSLREVAQAHKALGHPQQADDLLAQIEDDPDAITDRFLLLSLQGQPDEATRRLRLATETDVVRHEHTDLCLLAGNALMELRALQDGDPLKRLDDLHATDVMSVSDEELMDALLRLLPETTRLSDVLPSSVVDDPKSVYPHAGRDVEALVALARSDPATARRVEADLMYMLLMQDRDFWSSESRQLAEHALSLQPGLAAPARVLARRRLADGKARDALVLLQPLLASGNPDPEDLRLFLEAARADDHAEWGVALALFFENQPPLMTVLADTLAEWNHPDEALALYEKVLAATPDDPHAQAGHIAALAALHRYDEAEKAVDQAVTQHPDDAELAAASGKALAALFSPDARAVSLMQFLWNRNEDLDLVGEALARSAAGDDSRLRDTLARLADRAQNQPTEDDPDRAAARSQALVHAARTARDHGLLEQARQLNELALRAEPGAITLYRELGLLELQLGHLETARKYLEVLSFVDVEDRDAAMELARLDFRQLGQPVRAADVVRRTFSGTVPPDMVEILAAEDWLLGRPDDAITQFYQVSKSPLVSADTYMTVLRIAYAAGKDDVARYVADLVLKNTADDDPRRPRVQFLLDHRVQKPAAATAKP